MNSVRKSFQLVFILTFGLLIPDAQSIGSQPTYATVYFDYSKEAFTQPLPGDLVLEKLPAGVYPEFLVIGISQPKVSEELKLAKVKQEANFSGVQRLSEIDGYQQITRHEAVNLQFFLYQRNYSNLKLSDFNFRDFTWQSEISKSRLPVAISLVLTLNDIFTMQFTLTDLSKQNLTFYRRNELERALEHNFAIKTKKVLLKVKFGNFNSRTYKIVDFLASDEHTRQRRKQLFNDDLKAHNDEQANTFNWYKSFKGDFLAEYPEQKIDQVNWEWYYESVSQKYDIYSYMISKSHMLSRYKEEKIVFPPSYLESPFRQVVRVPAHTYRIFSSYTSDSVEGLVTNMHYTTFFIKPKVKSEIKSGPKSEPMDTSTSSDAVDSISFNPAYARIHQQIESLISSQAFKNNAVMMLTCLNLQNLQNLKKPKKTKSYSPTHLSGLKLVLKLDKYYQDYFKTLSKPQENVKLRAFLGFSTNGNDTVEGKFFYLGTADQSMPVKVSESFLNRAIDEKTNTLSFTLKFYIEHIYEKVELVEVIHGHIWEEDVIVLLDENWGKDMKGEYKATVFRKNDEGKFGEVCVARKGKC